MVLFNEVVNVICTLLELVVFRIKMGHITYHIHTPLTTTDLGFQLLMDMAVYFQIAHAHHLIGLYFFIILSFIAQFSKAKFGVAL